MNHKLIKFGVGGCFVFVALAATCVSGMVIERYRAVAAAPAGGSPKGVIVPSPKKAAPGSAATPDYLEDRRLSGPIHVRDRAHVDLTELMPDAARLAEELQPGATFYGGSGSGLQGGTLDVDHLKLDTQAYFAFEFTGLDKSKPPGKDKVEVRIDVSLSNAGDELVARASSGGISRSNHRDVGSPSFSTSPGCTGRRAFEAAVASGVPANAIASLRYADYHPLSAKSPLVWSVDIDGHDEYRREIDANTCAMVRNWGSKH